MPFNKRGTERKVKALQLKNSLSSQTAAIMIKLQNGTFIN